MVSWQHINQDFWQKNSICNSANSYSDQNSLWVKEITRVNYTMIIGLKLFLKKLFYQKKLWKNVNSIFCQSTLIVDRQKIIQWNFCEFQSYAILQKCNQKLIVK